MSESAASTASAVAPATPASPATPAPSAPSSPSSAPLAPNYTPPAPGAERTFKPGNFDDLDSLGGEPVKPAGDEPPKGAPPAAPAPAKPGEKPVAPPEPELDTDGVPKVKTNKELRQWAITQNKAAKELKVKAEAFEAKIKELQTAGTPPKIEEYENLTKQFAALESKVQDYETRLRFANYQQSNEYKEKYEQPINSAIERAHKFMEELRVEETNSDTGEVTYRAASAQDFNRLYHLDRADARTLAKQMFGDDANEVLGFRAKVRELSEAAGEAIEKYRKEGKEIETQRTLRSKQELEGTAQMWRDVNEDLGKKYPQWFKPVEGDEEGNKALEKGFALVDAALGENRSKMTVQERIIADANIRNRAAAFTKLALQNKKLLAEAAEKDKTIEKLRGSSPGGRPSSGGGEGAPKKDKGWEAEMDDRFPE